MCIRDRYVYRAVPYFGAPRGSPSPQPQGLRAIRQYCSPVQHLPHLEQGHQATFMLCPTNHAAVLGEQLLAGGTDKPFHEMFDLEGK